MKNLKGRCVFAQSGGPTTVINASIAGGLLEALENESVTGVLCAHHGIKGVLDEDFFKQIQKSDLCNPIKLLVSELKNRMTLRPTDQNALQALMELLKSEGYYE